MESDPTTEKIHGIPLITQPAEKHLNQRQIIDYSEERRDLITWALQIELNSPGDRFEKILCSVLPNRSECGS